MTPRIVVAMLAVLAVLCGAYFAAEHFREQGRSQVQAKWDAETLQRRTAESAAILTR